MHAVIPMSRTPVRLSSAAPLHHEVNALEWAVYMYVSGNDCFGILRLTLMAQMHLLNVIGRPAD